MLCAQFCLIFKIINHNILAWKIWTWHFHYYKVLNMGWYFHTPPPPPSLQKIKVTCKPGEREGFVAETFLMVKWTEHLMLLKFSFHTHCWIISKTAFPFHSFLFLTKYFVVSSYRPLAFCITTLPIYCLYETYNFFIYSFKCMLVLLPALGL